MSAMDDSPGGEIRVYEAPDESVRMDAQPEQETVWLTQTQMVELFGRGQSVSDKSVEFYNLDAIIAVGDRVDSPSGVRFRRRVTRVLREHVVTGCPFNPFTPTECDNKLKQKMAAEAAA